MITFWWMWLQESACLWWAVLALCDKNGILWKPTTILCKTLSLIDLLLLSRMGLSLTFCVGLHCSNRYPPSTLCTSLQLFLPTPALTFIYYTLYIFVYFLDDISSLPGHSHLTRSAWLVAYKIDRLKNLKAVIFLLLPQKQKT